MPPKVPPKLPPKKAGDAPRATPSADPAADLNNDYENTSGSDEADKPAPKASPASRWDRTTVGSSAAVRPRLEIGGRSKRYSLTSGSQPNSNPSDGSDIVEKRLGDEERAFVVEAVRIAERVLAETRKLQEMEASSSPSSSSSSPSSSQDSNNQTSESSRSESITSSGSFLVTHGENETSNSTSLFQQSVVSGAKVTALTTLELIEFIRDKSPFAKTSPTMQRFFLENANDVKESVAEFVSTAKEAASPGNRFDYLLRQRMINGGGKVVASAKKLISVLNSAESEVDDSGSEESASGEQQFAGKTGKGSHGWSGARPASSYDVAQLLDTASTRALIDPVTSAFSNLRQAVTLTMHLDTVSEDPYKPLESSSIAFVTGMNGLMAVCHSRQLWELESSLKQATLTTINSARRVAAVVQEQLASGEFDKSKSRLSQHVQVQNTWNRSSVALSTAVHDFVRMVGARGFVLPPFDDDQPQQASSRVAGVNDGGPVPKATPKTLSFAKSSVSVRPKSALAARPKKSVRPTHYECSVAVKIPSTIGEADSSADDDEMDDDVRVDHVSNFINDLKAAASTAQSGDWPTVSKYLKHMARGIESQLHRSKVLKLGITLEALNKKISAPAATPEQISSFARNSEQALMSVAQSCADVCDDVAVSSHAFSGLVERAMETRKRNPIPASAFKTSHSIVVANIDALLICMQHVCSASASWINATTRTLQAIDQQAKNGSQSVESAVDPSPSSMRAAFRSVAQRTMKRSDSARETGLPGDAERPDGKDAAKEKKSDDKDRNALFVEVAASSVLKLLTAQAIASADAPRRGTVLEEQFIEPVAQSQSTAMGNFFSTKLQIQETLIHMIDRESVAVRASILQVLTALAALAAHTGEILAANAFTHTSKPRRSDFHGDIFELCAAVRHTRSLCSSLLDSCATLQCVLTSTALDDQTAQQVRKSVRLLHSHTAAVRSNVDDMDWDFELEEDTEAGAETALIRSGENGLGPVIGGTPQALMHYLTSEQDSDFLYTFVISYESFISPWRMLALLSHRFQTGDGIARLRVGVVLKEWVDLYIDTLDSKVIEKLHGLFNSLEAAGQTVLANRLRDMVTNRREEIQREIKDRRRLDPLASHRLLFRIPEGGLTAAGNILRFSPSDIAQQLTLIQSRLYHLIQPTELLNQAWNKPKLQWKSRHVLDLIDRSNKFAYWVATLVVAPPTARRRARVITHLIQVGTELRQMGNFDSLIGVVAGLNVSAVSRLQHTWAKVDKHAREQMKKLQAVFDPSNSHKAYRTAYASARAKGAAIPYLGTPLTDLTFTEDGNDDTLYNDPSLVNFQKNTLIVHLIQDFLMAQEKRHSFIDVEPLHSFLSELPGLSDKELYDVSLLREPRGLSQVLA